MKPHKNIKAFISHCGQGAVHESIHHGVPFISFPLYSDQHVNTKTFEDLQITIRLDYETITKESVLGALNEIVNNTKYYEKTQHLAKLFRDKPMTPIQTVIYWTEYVIRHGGAPHLISPAIKLTCFQYLLLDVLCFIIFVLCIILFVIFYIFKWSCTSMNIN